MLYGIGVLPLFLLPLAYAFTSGLSLVASLLVFFAVSWLTRSTAAATLSADVRVVMEV